MLDYLRILISARVTTRDERGASAVEYGLLIAGIAALIVLAVYALGAQVNLLFSDTCDSMQGQRGAGTC